MRLHRPRAHWAGSINREGKKEGNSVTGRPRRTHTKIAVQLRISKESYLSVQKLIDTQVKGLASFSGLFETIVFLSEHMYIEEPDNGFVASLVTLKTKRLLEQLKLSERIVFRGVHVTIDRGAYEFIGMLKSRYGECFSSRSDVADLLLLNIGRSCSTSHEVRYYSRRLNEVLLLHPFHE